MTAARGQWGSKLGFVLAAAGSAVGLGNIWGFPYITASNGGGAFVLIYLACVALVGLPIMTAEILLGRASQQSPVGAFQKLAGKGSAWVFFGYLGIASSFIILSYYAAVAGWALYYGWLSISGQLLGLPNNEFQTAFSALSANPGLNIFLSFLFVGITIGVVMGGVASGVERASKIMMPALFAMLLGLLLYSVSLDGFGEGFSYLFSFKTDKLGTSSVLAALGQAFFSLSLGMGSILTYGSYLRKDDDIVGASITISVLDTAIALTGALVVFPLLFTANLSPDVQGTGLTFVSIPIAFSGFGAAGAVIAAVFFLLLVFAALTSAISMLEPTTAYFIDQRGWSRTKAALFAGTGIAFVGIPSAISASPAGGWYTGFSGNWFGDVAFLGNNIMLPLCGLGIALFTGYRLNEAIRHDHFLSGSKLRLFYKAWLFLLKVVAPIAIVFVFLNSIGII